MQCSMTRPVFNFQNQCSATQTNLRGCQKQLNIQCCIELCICITICYNITIHYNTVHYIALPFIKNRQCCALQSHLLYRGKGHNAQQYCHSVGSPSFCQRLICSCTLHISQCRALPGCCSQNCTEIHCHCPVGIAIHFVVVHIGRCLALSTYRCITNVAHWFYFAW